MTYKDIKHNEEVNELLKKGNQNLGLLGYTDHSQAHCVRVAETAAQILKKFGYSEHDIELARIAGYMHDIGNAINRNRHAEYGGLLANEILKQYDLSIPDRITIVSAISNHDESTGGAVDPISAALIIGDKTDVRRSRVREKPKATFDIHDRVNYAVTDQTLKINTEKKVISLNLQIDTDICSMYEYFEIFLQRMLMCRGAADMLGATFKLTANGGRHPERRQVGAHQRCNVNKVRQHCKQHCHPAVMRDVHRLRIVWRCVQHIPQDLPDVYKRHQRYQRTDRRQHP